MSFRGFSPWKNLGMDERGAMVKGGAIDGLADLAKAFVNAPITRRKLELAEARQRAATERSDVLFKQGQEDRTQRGKDRDLSNRLRVGGIAAQLAREARESTSIKGMPGDEKDVAAAYNRLRKLQPPEVAAMLPEYASADAAGDEDPGGTPDASPDKDEPGMLERAWDTAKDAAVAPFEAAGDVVGAVKDYVMPERNIAGEIADEPPADAEPFVPVADPVGDQQVSLAEEFADEPLEDHGTMPAPAPEPDSPGFSMTMRRSGAGGVNSMGDLLGGVVDGWSGGAEGEQRRPADRKAREHVATWLELDPTQHPLDQMDLNAVDSIRPDWPEEQRALWKAAVMKAATENVLDDKEGTVRRRMLAKAVAALQAPPRGKKPPTTTAKK